MKSVSSLPNFLKRYFWEIDTDRLSFREKPEYVIQRLLEVGDVRAVRWVNKKFAKGVITEVVQNRRGFSPKTANFWATFLKIPAKKVRCLQKPYLQQRATHWPF